MEYYDQVFNIVHPYAGDALGPSLSLDKEATSYITHGVIAFAFLFLLL